jgi:hypothetical protein
MLHRLIGTGLIAAVGAGAVIALGVACGTQGLSDGASSGGGGPPMQTGPNCAPGRAGCPCDVPGQSIACGTEVSRTGDYVMCSMGTSVCESGQWGACQGGKLQAQSLVTSSIDRQSRHVRHKVVACPQTSGGVPYDCDPNRCPPVTEGPSDVDAAGFVEEGDGVSLAPSCTGLACQVQNCVGNPFDAAPDAYAATTTITGHVYDPAGVNVLNNVSVFIPNDPTATLPGFVPGPSCDPCTYAGGASAPATVAVTRTAPDGSFTLTNVPSGANIPIVVQVGKWRRKITLPSVTPCSVNKILPEGTLRLPRNQTDGDNNHADLPKMAFVNGGGPDDLECLLLKMGLDPNEFGSLHMNTNRALHYYMSPDKPSTPLDPAYGESNLSGQVLWSSAATLGLYDLVILGCDGGDYTDNGRSPGGYQNLTNYANGGGRVYLSHYSRSWMMNNPPWNQAAYSWPNSWTLGSLTATIDTSTPFGQWLVNVKAATVAGDAGTMAIQAPHQTSVAPLGPGVRSLMTAGPGVYADPNGSLNFSPNFEFDTPFQGGADGGAAACGRVVYADFHVSSADKLSSPTSCSTSADCGYGSTCPPPTGGLGTCNANPCTPMTIGTDCAGAADYTCPNTIKGFCGCMGNSDCAAVGGGTCVNGVCSLATCFWNGDCPSGPKQQCNGSAPGICTPNTCTTNANCANDGTEQCLNGLCNGCNSDVDCPGAETCSKQGAVCTGNLAYAPQACAKSAMTPQEEALEYELFDLGACVVPVAPAGARYVAATFTEDLASTCATGQIPVWRELDWYANVPNTSSIQFFAQTASAPADGGLPDYSSASLPLVPIYTATTSNLPPPPDGGAGNPGRVLIDVGPGGPIIGDAAPVIDAAIPGAFQVAMPPVSSLADLRLTIKLIPTADMMSTPTLYSWTVKWDCVPSE